MSRRSNLWIKIHDRNWRKKIQFKSIEWKWPESSSPSIQTKINFIRSNVKIHPKSRHSMKSICNFPFISHWVKLQQKNKNKIMYMLLKDSINLLSLDFKMGFYCSFSTLFMHFVFLNKSRISSNKSENATIEKGQQNELKLTYSLECIWHVGSSLV